MEAVEAFLDGEWESLTKLFSCEDSDIQLHFNGSNFFSNEGSNFLASGENFAASLLLPSHNLHTSFYCVSQESSNSTDIDSSLFTSMGDHENNHLDVAANFVHDHVAADHTFESMNLHSRNESLMVPVFPDDLMEEILQLKAQICNAETQPAETYDSCKEMQLKRKYEAPSNALQSSDQSLKKRPRVSRDAQRNKRSTESRKNKKGCNDEEGKTNGQSSSSCSSEEDDSESKGSASTAKAKTGKGAATDPQSLYARKRRERINERLRILQNLVPNGTKVDISTMLEEAVHYVKFLQLQIKLLSSDDMWMYAPIAYNGMDIGHYHKIVPNQN